MLQSKNKRFSVVRESRIRENMLEIQRLVRGNRFVQQLRGLVYLFKVEFPEQSH